MAFKLNPFIGTLDITGGEDLSLYLKIDRSNDILPYRIHRYGNGLVKSVDIGDRTVTFTRDVNDLIESWTDGVYIWTVTRDVNNLIETLEAAPV